jgi:hypothetical protein
MSGKPVKWPATKNRPAAVGFVTQAWFVRVNLACVFLKGAQPQIQ